MPGDPWNPFSPGIPKPEGPGSPKIKISFSLLFIFWFYTIVYIFKLPGGPWVPGGPGLPIIDWPGGPGGPIKVWVSSSNCSNIKSSVYIIKTMNYLFYFINLNIYLLKLLNTFLWSHFQWSYFPSETKINY